MPIRNGPYITQIKVDKTKQRNKNDLVSVVLLGENHGYRMKSYGPISLIKIGEKTVLEHQVEIITSTFPKVEILLCCGFDANKVSSFVRSKLRHVNIRVLENQLFNNSNCCESVRLCLNNTMNDKVIICNGELIFNHYHLEQLSLENSSVLSQEQNPDKNLDVNIISNDGYIENMSLGLMSSYWCEMISLVDEKNIRQFIKILSPPEYKNKLLFEAINDLASKSSIEVVDILKPPVRKINNIKSFKKASLV